MSSSSKSVLIIEHDRDRSIILERAVGECVAPPCRSAVAASLGEGLKLLGSRTFDLVVARLQLPDTRDLQAIVNLQRASADLPVIAVLEGGEDQAIEEAASSLVDDCLRWDEAEPGRLKEAIELALDRRDMLRELRSRRKGREAACRRAEEALEETEPQRQRSPAAEGAWGVPATLLGGEAKILVVEDEPVLRMAVASTARSLGFGVVEAADGIEALQRYKEHKGEFLFALIDLNMPRMDGRRLLAAIRKDRRSLPVAVMSGEEDVSRESLSEGDAESCFYLSKPFGMIGLKEVVAKLKALAARRVEQLAQAEG